MKQEIQKGGTLNVEGKPYSVSFDGTEILYNLQWRPIITKEDGSRFVKLARKGKKQYLVEIDPPPAATPSPLPAPSQVEMLDKSGEGLPEKIEAITFGQNCVAIFPAVFPEQEKIKNNRSLLQINHFDEEARNFNEPFAKELAKRYNGYTAMYRALKECREWYERNAHIIAPDTPVCFTKAFEIINTIK